MRRLVGPTDDASFDNPSGDFVVSDVAAEQFEAVLDFGCGCGRIARKLIQQRQRPKRYVGFDLHPGLVSWCQRELSPLARGFEFFDHPIFNAGFRPDRSLPDFLPMPADTNVFRLLIAWSVFTHTTQVQAEHYLREASRVLHPGGVMVATFFLFEKEFFPMMQDFQNALYINSNDVTNAVIFDRVWLQSQLNQIGLCIVKATPPGIRGYQCLLHIRHTAAGEPAINLPEDRAPFGSVPPPLMTNDPSKLGL